MIVVADAGHQVDQWPNGQHSTEYQPIYVNPIPLPDLVLSNVVVPDPGHRRQHVQRQLHGHQPGRGPDPGEYLDRLGLADASTRPGRSRPRATSC